MKRTIILLIILFPFLFTISTAQQWTWMKGNKSGSRWAVFGTKGIPDPANNPGARWAPVTWTDINGNLWMFGGDSYLVGMYGRANDLWKFDISTNNWIWISGSTVPNDTGNNGVKGVTAPSNYPGGKESAVGWIDKDGNFWLFGGYSFMTSGYGYFNDLWKYDVQNNLWTWMKGSATKNQESIYGTKGVADINNTPGARGNSTTWTDLEGNLWLYGGYGNGSGSVGYLNDLWKYNVSDNTWTWMKGDDFINASGFWYNKGVENSYNYPCSSSGSVGWTDNQGNLWLFGGMGYLPAFGIIDLLWKYNTSTNNWTWVNGTGLVMQNGVYGTIGVPDPANTPGGRYYLKGWKDKNNDFWIFAGEGYGSSSIDEGRQNDLWNYNINSNQWTWMKGSTLINQKGIYGVQGTADMTNNPGARLLPGAWIDKAGNIWIFGGWSFDADSVSNYSNDLWKFTPAATLLCADVEIKNGWNILSLPVLPNDATVAGLFPGATSQAFGYNNGYVTTNSFDLAKGYWLKFGSDGTANICGEKSTGKIILNIGWNIIGIYENDLQVATLNTKPAGILTSQFFGYNNGYVTASTLESGKGYWIKSSQVGEISLTAASGKSKIYNCPEIETSWPRIKFTDAQGRVGNLYFTNSDLDLDKYELPPIPPKGIFDIRFVADRFVEKLDAEIKEIKLNSAKYPVTIQVYGIDVNLTDKFNGKIINSILKSGDKYIVSNPAIEMLQVKTNSLPDGFALHQNFPNPFNPVTKIKYDLPVDCKVKITVFNLIGEQILKLIDQNVDAGYNEVEFDAGSMSSGIYLYRIDAVELSSNKYYNCTKKMILIK